MKIKKSWTEKLYEDKQVKVKRIDFPFADIPEDSDMAILTPKVIDQYINEIPFGKSVDVKTLRKDLAMEHRADYSCPVTTGIFLRVVAEAAYEKYQHTKSWENITPFWRVIEPSSPLATKLSFGKSVVVAKRKSENIT